MFGAKVRGRRSTGGGGQARGMGRKGITIAREVVYTHTRILYGTNAEEARNENSAPPLSGEHVS